MENSNSQNKKNVIIFTGALSSGGAEKQSILLAKALDVKYQILLVSFYGERELERYITFLKDNKIQYLQLKGGLLNKLRLFIQTVRIQKPIAIINFLPSNNVIGGLFGKLFGVNKIIGGVRSSRQSFFKYLELLISHHIFNTKTVFNNYSGLEYFSKRGFTKSKSIVITNCLDPIPEKIEKIVDSELTILIVSRFEAYKDYYTALNAFEILINTALSEKIFLDIVGTGPLENEIRDWISSHKLDHRINIHINPENIFDFYKKADIFLQTSLFEGFSNSIMEAMSYCLPIIATDVGDNGCLVENGKNGFLSPVAQSDIIAQNLKILLENPQIRIQMGNNSYEIIKNNFSLQKFANDFNQVIES